MVACEGQRCAQTYNPAFLFDLANHRAIFLSYFYNRPIESLYLQKVGAKVTLARAGKKREREPVDLSVAVWRDVCVRVVAILYPFLARACVQRNKLL